MINTPYHSYENVEEMDNDFKPVKALSPVIKLSKDDYECLPSYMKGLAPWKVWNSSPLSWID